MCGATDGWGVDVLFEASGNPKVYPTMFDLVRPGGAVVIVGLPVTPIEFNVAAAVIDEPRIETVFMLPGEPYSYLSAKLVREIAQLGGPLTGLVPPLVEERLRAKVL